MRKGLLDGKKKILCEVCEIHRDLPQPEEYTLRCKLCWGGGNGQLSESTSDSRDELSLSD